MTTTCDSNRCNCMAQTADHFEHVSALNTLAFSAGECINCGMCSEVCPHGVFAPGERVIRIVDAHACMECGACAHNCPVGALQVDSGVGCAAAMIYAALRGKEEPTCEGPELNCCQ
jgi:NAD-dependent dihydropyrimidine dehydrogenase PreA subunit